VPVVGIILAHKQQEYKGKARPEAANAAIERLTRSAEMSIVPIDTALENNAGGLRTAGEVESLISRMDVVITTRLHGAVLSLKNGIPVVPIDPIAGGAKISAQIRTLGWPLLFNAEHLDDEQLRAALDFCLTDGARQTARECARRAVTRIEGLRRHLIDQLKGL
jgi:exopolysaccharide biosynthesis predicted pyruvyltransferase EpsI